MIDLHSCLDSAKEAALNAGELLRSHIDQDKSILLNEGRDIKLELDIKAERLIIDLLTAKHSFSILGEETGFSGINSECYWVVDPLDGTSNYLRNIPIACVSIALMRDLDPLLGVIYDFNLDELYFGSLEQHAMMNESTISVSKFNKKDQATLVTGIPAKSKYTDDEFNEMISDFQMWKKIRMIGSAAMASVYVASGKAEIYKENGIFLWDIAAGAAITRAAGGKISIENMNAQFRVNAKFTNGLIE